MITNLEYLKTALQVLQDGTTPMNEAKILKVMAQICQQNIKRIETNLVDDVEDQLYN